MKKNIMFAAGLMMSAAATFGYVSPSYAADSSAYSIASDLYKYGMESNSDVALDISGFHLDSSDSNIMKNVLTILSTEYFSSVDPDLTFSHIQGENEFFEVTLSSLSEEEHQKEDTFQKTADAFVATLAGYTDEEKAMKISEYVMNVCEYDYSYTRRTAYDCLVNGSAVCQGYASAFYHLCTKAGMTCEVVSGQANNGTVIGSHAWNRVLLNGEWKYFDLTWTDTCNRNYLMMAENQMKDYMPERYL